MSYRQLNSTFIDWLNCETDGVALWPAYQSLRWYSRETDLIFTHREYARLRKYSIGSAEIVETMAACLARFRSPQIQSLFGTADDVTSECLLDGMTTLVDADELFQQDYFRGCSWRELPLILAMRDRDGESRSICRSEELVRQLSLGTFLEAGRPFVARRDRRNRERLIAAVEKSIGHPLNDHADMCIRLWRELPECVWLVTTGKKVIGGSIVLPVSERVYNGMLAGTQPMLDVAASDLESPGRRFRISAFVTLPGKTPSRLPGIWSAIRIRKLCQYGANLIGDAPTETRPVQICTATRNKDDVAALTRLGYRNTNNFMHGSKNPGFELTIPAPEQTRTDFSTPATTIASLMGICWQLLNS